MTKESGTPGSHTESPLTVAQARQRWPREAIREHLLPQPPHAKKQRVTYQQTAATSAKLGLHNHARPGLPKLGDITVEPEGGRYRPDQLKARGQRVNPLTVYPPDGRHVFHDTTYPWRCCGRVVTARGQGAGALVGPRHLLTVSHVVNWTANGAGWLLFQPDYYNGNVFSAANAQLIYSYEKITSSSEGEYDIAEDYVVCVLDQRLGDQLGWLGTKTYSDDWDGGNYWSHVGYPGDVGGGIFPARETWFSIANSWHPGFFEAGSGLDIETFASTNHGDSGGPVFGYWNDGPYIVGVVSAEGSLDGVITDPSTRTGNWIAGGSPMPDLVNQARSDHP